MYLKESIIIKQKVLFSLNESIIIKQKVLFFYKKVLSYETNKSYIFQKK